MNTLSQRTVPLALALAALALNSSAATPLYVGVFLENAPMLTARAHHSATSLNNGKVLVVGGLGDMDEGFPVLASAELYDPANGMWTATGSMNHARFHHTATLLADGKVLVVGGLASPSKLGPRGFGFPNAKELASDGLAALSSGSSVTPSSVTVAELYDPATGKWTETGALNTVRFADTATLLPNGKVLLTGNAEFLDGRYSAEIYDPAAGYWTPASPASTTFFRVPTATLLRDGQVLVVGGAQVGIRSFTAAIFNPASGKMDHHHELDDNGRTRFSNRDPIVERQGSGRGSAFPERLCFQHADLRSSQPELGPRLAQCLRCGQITRRPCWETGQC